MSTFEIDLRHRLGEHDIALRIDTSARMVALFGPSGAGKSSILNMVAGLIEPKEGRIVVDGSVLFDSAAGVHIPPAERHAGYVFQDRRLFPHMKVRANLLYGRRGTPPMPFEEVLDFLGIAHLLDRWPSTLSGGEAQRVAIGRALLSGPRFLLMDEPLSSLDQPRRKEILGVIQRIKQDLAMPMLYVSHDRDELRQIADEIVEI